jgi:hypothetical protein
VWVICWGAGARSSRRCGGTARLVESTGGARRYTSPGDVLMACPSGTGRAARSPSWMPPLPAHAGAVKDGRSPPLRGATAGSVLDGAEYAGVPQVSGAFGSGPSWLVGARQRWWTRSVLAVRAREGSRCGGLRARRIAVRAARCRATQCVRRGSCAWRARSAWTCARERVCTPRATASSERSAAPEVDHFWRAAPGHFSQAPKPRGRDRADARRRSATRGPWRRARRDPLWAIREIQVAPTERDGRGGIVIQG